MSQYVHSSDAFWDAYERVNGTVPSTALWILCPFLFLLTKPLTVCDRICALFT
jgi:hypothetical protein